MRKPPRRKFRGNIAIDLWTAIDPTPFDLYFVVKQMLAGLATDNDYDTYEVSVRSTEFEELGWGEDEDETF